MKSFVSNILNLGVDEELGMFEKRKIELTNAFSLIAFGLLMLFAIINFIGGDYMHALKLFSGIFVLVFPIAFLNSKRLFSIARVYFVISVIVYTNYLGYSSIFNHENRYNEVLLIGASAFIPILFDGVLNKVTFIIMAASSMIMLYVRAQVLGHTNELDLTLSFVNMATAFFCIYQFTRIYRKDLERSMIKLERQSKSILNKNEIIKEKTFVLRSMIDNIPIFLAILEVDGRYKVVNSKFEEAFQVKLEEIEGQHANKLLSSGMAKIQDEFIRQGLAGKEVEFDRKVKLNNGASVDVYGKIVPLYDDARNVTAFVQYGMDVTKLKTAQSQLSDMIASRNKLISIVSHDLKTPVNSLISLMELADQIEPEQLSGMLRKLRNQIDAVGFTMDNLLNWVRTQMDGFKVHPKMLDLSKTIQRCIDLYASQIEEKNLIVNNKIESPLMVFADLDSMALVYRNFISNAIKFTPKNGQLSFSFSKEKNQTKVSFEDTGMGMTEEELKKLKDSQSKFTKLGTDGESGTGLGMGFCIDLLNLNNVKFEIESTLNKGTTIALSFTEQEENES